jgi:hypothetical protein
VNIVADESIDGPVVRRLRDDVHDVVYLEEAADGSWKAAGH